MATTTSIQSAVIQPLVTAGTFQQSEGNQVFFKLNADTSTLIWGTRLGSSVANTYFTSASNFGVNETGIYLYGQAEQAVGGYYATPGAFRTQISGSKDLFLTKFDETGNRIWGTYFGGNGNDETSNSSITIAVKTKGL